MIVPDVDCLRCYKRAMRIPPVAAGALLLLAGSCLGQVEIIKPYDFQPLTSLPWLAPHATLAGTLDAIYHEPDARIRYQVLFNYLWTVPAGQLGAAFDRCVTFEGVQSPDSLVYFFLQIWGARDPEACWKKTQQLFHLVGIEYGPLDYGSWDERITVQDIDAIRASPYWITSAALKSFPLGVEQSSLPEKERVRIMKEFANLWFANFGTWPGNPTPGAWQMQPPSDYFYNDPELMQVFSMPLEELRHYATVNPNPGPGMFDIYINWGDEPGFDMAERRWLQAEPGSAPEIIKTMERLEPVYEKDHCVYPSLGLLVLWAKLDQPGMIRWADAGDMHKDEAIFEARALLMGRVDDATRARWLAQAKGSKPDDDRTEDFVLEWGGWDPARATSTVVASATSNRDWDLVVDAARGAAYGADSFTQGECHWGLEALKNINFGKLTPNTRLSVNDQWDVMMEQWAGIDIGEAARYGIDFLNKTHYPRRDAMMRYFSGKDVEGEDTGMVERVMCALRVWAVVRPKEMKAWIGTLKDPALEKALTWLLNHPWGGGLNK